MSEMDLIYQWFERAKNDLICAEHLFNDLYPKQIDISCYHCQQSAEKALKGYLEYKGIDIPRTHNLVLLCQICEDINESFSDLADNCSDLTPYSVQARYPNEIVITEEEATTALKETKQIFNFTICLVSNLEQLLQN